MDPDYAYTDKEERQRVQHKQQYVDYIKGLREKRLLHEKKRYIISKYSLKQLKIRVTSDVLSED